MHRVLIHDIVALLAGTTLPQGLCNRLGLVLISHACILVTPFIIYTLVQGKNEMHQCKVLVQRCACAETCIRTRSLINSCVGVHAREKGAPHTCW